MDATLAARVTAEDLLAVPDDGVDRELIQGQLKEKPMTVRNRFHTRAVTSLAYRHVTLPDFELAVASLF